MPPVVEALDLRRTYRTTTGTISRRSLEIEPVRRRGDPLSEVSALLGAELLIGTVYAVAG